MSSSVAETLATCLPRGRRRWSECLLLRALAPMRRGRLHLEFPGGEMHVLGEPPAPPTAAEHPPARPAAVVRVRDRRFFDRCAWFGDIGFAESYMAGEWESEDLTAVFRWFLANLENAPGLSGTRRRLSLLNLLGTINRLQHRLRPNSLRLSQRNIREHYDLSNRFFATFLDAGLSYSSAWWSRPDLTLAEAQEAKNDRLCRQLRLNPADHVLEIGCGWGGFAEHAASRYGCRVTGITLSREQYAHARARIAAAGLAGRVDILLRDYRAVEGRFTKIASIEMLEAVGHRYLPQFTAACDRLLEPQGLLGLQFIVCPDSRYDALRRGVDFIQRHIFPGSLLLSLNRVSGLLSSAGGFWLHDLHDFGPCYARTLNLWHERFRAACDKVRAQGFNESFIRKWSYYLAYCEAAFATRNISVVQALYTRANNPELDRAPDPPVPSIPHLS
jgi:cyclopropane-fatty-acyl-phospholipid synthase